MVAFLMIAFAIGGVLATTVSVRQFAFGTLVLEVAGFAQAVHVGIPVVHALLGAAGLFVCGQFGYVAGVGVVALVVAKTKRSGDREAANRADKGAEFKARGPTV
jgi:hypothetical protein